MNRYEAMEHVGIIGFILSLLFAYLLAADVWLALAVPYGATLAIVGSIIFGTTGAYGQKQNETADPEVSPADSATELLALVASYIGMGVIVVSIFHSVSFRWGSAIGLFLFGSGCVLAVFESDEAERGTSMHPPDDPTEILNDGENE